MLHSKLDVGRSSLPLRSLASEHFGGDAVAQIIEGVSQRLALCHLHDLLDGDECGGEDIGARGR